jgi:hypothetical protein
VSLIGSRDSPEGDSGGRLPLRAVANFQAFPSEEARIDRPHARPDERECGPKSSDHDATAAILRIRERSPKRCQSQERAAERGPQTDDEEGTQSDANYLQQSTCERRSTVEPTDRTNNRRASGYETD